MLVPQRDQQDESLAQGRAWIWLFVSKMSLLELVFIRLV